MSTPRTVTPRSGAAGRESLTPTTLDGSFGVPTVELTGLPARIWDRVGGPELILLVPIPLILLARLGLHPRIDAAAAAILSVALPVVLGMAALAVPARVLRGRPHRWTLLDVGTAAAVGLLMSLALAMVLQGFDRFGARTIGLIVLGFGGFAWVYLRVADRLDAAEGRPDRPVPWADILGGLAAVGLGLALATWYRVGSPVPFHPQWDAFVHLRVIEPILDGNWSPWTTDYSSTFRVNAYFPVQQLLTAVSSNLTRVDPLSIYWGGPYVMIPTIAILGYGLARALDVRQVTAVVAAGAAIVAGLTFQATAFLGLLPLAMAHPFFSLALLAGLARASTPRVAGTIVVLGLGAFISHWLVGGAVLAFGIGLLLLRWLDRRYDRLWIVAAAAVTFVTVVLFLGYSGIRPLPSAPVGVTSGDERNFGRLVSLAWRQGDFQNRLSPVLAFVSAAGAMLLAWRAPAGSIRVIVPLAWAGALVALAMPVAGADRGFAVLPAIIAPTLAIALDRALDWTLRPGPGLGERGFVAGIAMVGAIVLAIQPVFWLKEYQTDLAAEAPFFSSFARSELDAGTALARRTPTSTFLVSDPLTQEILGGLGQRESLGGGPYASDEQLEAVRAALLAEDAEESWERLWDVAHEAGAQGPVLVPITGRTGRWLEHPIGYWPGYYSKLETYRESDESAIPDILFRLSDEQFFQPVWLTDDVVIVALRPVPDEPVEGIGGPWYGASPTEPRPPAS